MNPEKMWCVTILMVTGVKREYRLSDDLQFALNLQGHFKRLKNALLVVPLGPYVDINGKEQSIVEPPFGVIKIESIYRIATSDARKLHITRSQFIGGDLWPTWNYQKIYGYLKHDYPKLSQWQISKDIKYWIKKQQGKQVSPNPFSLFITKVRINRQIKRLVTFQANSIKHDWKITK